MQKDLEDKMLETGTLPADRLPSVANGESMLPETQDPYPIYLVDIC